MSQKQFKGVIKLDVRDSVPDWEPYIPARAPEGAPNILFVLYDDTGLAAWSPFGGRINMPTLQKLADHGLISSQWHTTALCSPTRSTFLTGRNHAPALPKRRTDSRVRWAGCRPSARRSARSCRTTVTARSGSGRTTTCRRRTSRRARADPSGRSRKVSIASMDSSGARPTTGIPISSRQPLHRPAVSA